jgi:hypothetical protein
MADCDLVD